MNSAKNLPTTIADMTAASDKLSKINIELSDLREKFLEIDKISNQLEIANRRIADLQKTQEENPPVAAIGSGDGPQATQNIEKWQKASDLWFEVKDAIEEMIDKIYPERVKRAYNSIPRYTYENVAPRLVKDKILTQTKADALQEMDRLFRSIRNKRIPVTNEMIKRFQDLRDSVLR